VKAWAFVGAPAAVCHSRSNLFFPHAGINHLRRNRLRSRALRTRPPAMSSQHL
jgi:hypothetical protein